jgi:hypothetical protein
MTKENYVYTEKDIFVGFQFSQFEHIYEIVCINPINFKNIKSEYLYKNYEVSEVVKNFNDLFCTWIPISLPQSKNIELWI